ncbi:tRNA-uridine aminocarboxypropyltransferase [Mangrovitalea sediminis]|uniref:tRNA-uridine aminocarboxypropyltransferase n=1 Tax=Mangrovitalea sediminis TaxID=1982043 RepID=UPI001303F6DB|nr:DTW domain-containing protein [Mangrovitalea sediminis]
MIVPLPDAPSVQGEPPRRPFRARGANVVRCGDCRLPDRNCICTFRPRLNAAVDFWLMMHPDEVYKPTNTGRLIEECLPGTRRFRWQRREADPAFEAALTQTSIQPYIVFPAKGEPYQHRCQPFRPEPGKRPVFILLDGTWQQAGKMFRLTRYLDPLPVLSLTPEQGSEYGLRKASHEGQLCTAEVAAALLQLAGFAQESLLLTRYFRVFSRHYVAGRHSRSILEDDEDMRCLRDYRGQRG